MKTCPKRTHKPQNQNKNDETLIARLEINLVLSDKTLQPEIPRFRNLITFLVELLVTREKGVTCN